MELALVAIALAGALAGLAASALPGFHVNTLALATLALAPQAGEPGQVFLVAAFAAGPFGGALPSTFLGASGEEGALASLPAHQLAREGRGVEAVALQCWGALAGLLVALPLAFAARPLFVWSAPYLASASPWIALVILLALVLSERARPKVHRRKLDVPYSAGGRWVTHERVEGPLSPWAGRALAFAAVVVAGALGWAALRMGARSPLGLPGSPLLPLLAGLFAAPELLAAARGAKAAASAALRAAPAQRILRHTFPGAAVSALEGLAPGVSPSMAAMLSPRAPTPEARLLRLAAVNGGAVVFTLLAWHALAKPRAGALVAAQAMAAPSTWPTIAPPLPVVSEGALVIVAALVACLAVRGLSRPLSLAIARRSPARWAMGGLAMLVLAVALTTGGPGLLELLAACLVGAALRRFGLRRSLGMASILVPVMLRGWGVA